MSHVRERGQHGRGGAGADRWGNNAAGRKPGFSVYWSLCVDVGRCCLTVEQRKSYSVFTAVKAAALFWKWRLTKKIWGNFLTEQTNADSSFHTCCTENSIFDSSALCNSSVWHSTTDDIMFELQRLTERHRDGESSHVLFAQLMFLLMLFTGRVIISLLPLWFSTLIWAVFNRVKLKHFYPQLQKTPDTHSEIPLTQNISSVVKLKGKLEKKTSVGYSGI